MANWLEAEEHKKSLLLQREQTVHGQLTAFYDLCNRVNAVRPDSLSIDRLRANGTRTYKIHEMVDAGDGDRSGMVMGKRGIRISSPNPDEVFIDVVIYERHSSYYREVGYLNSDEENVVLRKTCAIQYLSEWREDQILLAIQWMMLETEDIRESIPGTDID
jgi:hypothetical protein